MKTLKPKLGIEFALVDYLSQERLRRQRLAPKGYEILRNNGKAVAAIRLNNPKGQVWPAWHIWLVGSSDTEVYFTSEAAMSRWQELVNKPNSFWECV